MKTFMSAEFLSVMLLIAALSHVTEARANKQAVDESVELDIPNQELSERFSRQKASRHGFASKRTPDHYEPKPPLYAGDDSGFDVATLEYPKQPLYQTMLDQFGSMMKAIMKLPGSLLRAVSVVINGREYVNRQEEDAESDEYDSQAKS